MYCKKDKALMLQSKPKNNQQIQLNKQYSYTTHVQYGFIFSDKEWKYTRTTMFPDFQPELVAFST